MQTKTENEIIKNWTKTSPPLVSIDCCTYNQDQFISKTIESFLMQETSFPFEIIIHDDASTDNTVSIIQNYVKNFPHIIKPIYQTQNQYSKKQGSISARFVWPNAQGKYIALCEGDDYWTDSLKLQKQVDLLEKNPEFSGCFHNALVVFNDNSEPDKSFCSVSKKDQSFDTKDLILNDWFIPTASIMFNKSKLNSYPEWSKEVFNHDLLLQLFLSINGKIAYIDEIMSVYRKKVEKSVSTTKHKASFFMDSLIFLLLKFNKYTKLKYAHFIGYRVIVLYIRREKAVIRSILNKLLNLI